MINRQSSVGGVLIALLTGTWLLGASDSMRAASSSPPQVPSSPPQSVSTAGPTSAADARGVFDKYCVTCHNQRSRTAGLALDTLDIQHVSGSAGTWERVIGKLRQASMPPPGRPRPDSATYRTVATWLENEIDRAWSANPYPGRIG